MNHAGGALEPDCGTAIDTTERVHEAFLRLCEPANLTTLDRVQFMALSVSVMRQNLGPPEAGRTCR